MTLQEAKEVIAKKHGVDTFNLTVWMTDEAAELYAQDLQIKSQELANAVSKAMDCINYLGDILNDMDATTEEDEEHTTPLIEYVRYIMVKHQIPERV